MPSFVGGQRERYTLHAAILSPDFLTETVQVLEETEEETFNHGLRSFDVNRTSFFV
jgi:hypothetical protein